MKKNSLAIIMAVFVFIAMLPYQAIAAEYDAIEKISEGAVSIELELPQASGEKISSLQLSLEAVRQDGTPLSADDLEKIEKFVFAPEQAVSETAKVCEQRYHKETGLLTIFVAGTESLFSENDKLTLGTVTAVFQNNQKADIYVKVTTDSLKSVKGITLKTYVDEEDVFSIALIKGINNPGVTEEPDETSKPDETPEPDETSRPDETPKPDETQAPDGTQDPASSQAPNQTQAPQIQPDPGVSSNPQETDDPNQAQDPTMPNIDRSKLEEALKVAETLKESDYTSESFAQLKKAVQDGKAVLENSNATQQEIDEAADAIYNAIGALVLHTGTSSDAISSNVQEKNSSSTVQSVSNWTGDASSAVICIILLIVSAAVVAFLTIRKKINE